MAESIFLSALLAGLFSSNIVASTGAGIELGTNNLSSVKNALTYSLIIGLSALLSSVTLFVLNLILKTAMVEEFFIVAVLLVAAIFVQMAEYLVKKIMPLFFTQTKYFVPSLVSSLFIILVCAFGAATSFVHLLIIVIAECLGVLLVLTVVAGIRSSHNNLSRPVLNGNLLSLVILLFVMMAFTAF